MDLTIITPTYNRPDKLSKLYESLSYQTNKNFDWIIIDDGSKFSYEYQIAKWKKESNFSIIYEKKENGGKSRAINRGLDLIRDSTFVLIVDDDEQLYDNAIELVLEYIYRYKDSDCGGIEFLRDDINGYPISNYDIHDDFIMSVQERKKRNYEIDGYIGYFVKALNNIRFPEFRGEKYVGPGVLQLLISKKYTLLWSKVSLGKTVYLEDGITKQGRKLRLANLQGMIFYCSLLQTNESGFKVRFKYSIMGFAYLFCNIKNFFCRKKEINQFMKIGIIPGLILAAFWKIKYLK